MYTAKPKNRVQGLTGVSIRNYNKADYFLDLCAQYENEFPEYAAE